MQKACVNAHVPTRVSAGRAYPKLTPSANSIYDTMCGASAFAYRFLPHKALYPTSKSAAYKKLAVYSPRTVRYIHIYATRIRMLYSFAQQYSALGCERHAYFSYARNWAYVGSA